MRLRMILGFVPLLVCMALGCGGDGTIASGGNFVLRVDDLRREVSNLGPESKYKDTAEGRLAVVNKLAARSYLADEAERRGYGGDDLEQVVKNAEAEAVAQVYRTWKIDKSVMIPRIQTKPWIQKLDRRLHVRELIFAVYPVAEAALEDLREGREFDDLAAEAESREDVRVNDLGWAAPGDLSTEIGNLLFRLDVGEASQVITGPDGYRIFYLAEDERLGQSLEILSVRSKRFVTELEKERLIQVEKEELTRRYDVQFRDDGVVAALEAFGASFGGQRADDVLMDELLATYSDGEILVADLFVHYFSAPAQGRPYVGDYYAMREFAIQTVLPRLEALAGYDMGLDRSAEVVWAAKRAREDHLIPIIEDHFKSQVEVADQEIADYFAEHGKVMVTPTRYRLRRIVVSSSEKVREVRSQIAAGKDFAQVAMELSEDEYTAARGGDLDWVRAGLVAAYDSVVKELRPGEISDPFTTRFGIEILKFEDKEDSRPLTFEEAAPRIRAYLAGIRANELVDEWVTNKRSELGFTVDKDLLETVRLPLPKFMQQHGRTQSEEEGQIRALPKMD